MTKKDPAPSVVALGHTTRLVHIDEIAKEFNQPRFAVIEWLEELGVPVLTVGHEPYVHQSYLELAVWWHGRPMELRTARTDGELLRQFSQEMYTLGRIYRGMSYEYALHRLRALMRPLTKARVRGTYPKASRGVLEDASGGSEPPRHGMDNADPVERLGSLDGDAPIQENR